MWFPISFPIGLLSVGVTHLDLNVDRLFALDYADGLKLTGATGVIAELGRRTSPELCD